MSPHNFRDYHCNDLGRYFLSSARRGSASPPSCWRPPRLAGWLVRRPGLRWGAGRVSGWLLLAPGSRLSTWTALPPPWLRGCEKVCWELEPVLKRRNLLRRRLAVLRLRQTWRRSWEGACRHSTRSPPRTGWLRRRMTRTVSWPSTPTPPTLRTLMISLTSRVTSTPGWPSEVSELFCWWK